MTTTSAVARRSEDGIAGECVDQQEIRKARRGLKDCRKLSARTIVGVGSRLLTSNLSSLFSRVNTRQSLRRRQTNPFEGRTSLMPRPWFLVARLLYDRPPPNVSRLGGDVPLVLFLYINLGQVELLTSNLPLLQHCMRTRLSLSTVQECCGRSPPRSGMLDGFHFAIAKGCMPTSIEVTWLGCWEGRLNGGSDNGRLFTSCVQTKRQQFVHCSPGPTAH